MTAEFVETIRQRVLAAPEKAPPLVLAVKAEMPWLSPTDVADTTRTLYEDLYQLGVLTPLIEDPMVTDIFVNAPDEVWVIGAGVPERAGISFHDERAVRTLATRLAAQAGRLLDDAHPFVDLDYHGLRINAVLPPISRSGTTISIRRRRQNTSQLDQLIQDPVVRRDLDRVIDARSNFLISGGTGSGKTTLLNAIIDSLPASQRLVVIEDTAEITSHHPHCVWLEARPANSEGRGEISMRELVRQSLRMRPDRILIGEVRGPEVLDLLAALNTGHAGSGGTIHARSATDVPGRVEALAIFGGIPAPAAHSLLLSSIDVIIHLKTAGAKRGIESISRVDRAGDRAVIRTEFAY